jgi:hypothetical protein
MFITASALPYYRAHEHYTVAGNRWVAHQFHRHLMDDPEFASALVRRHGHR